MSGARPTGATCVRSCALCGRYDCGFDPCQCAPAPPVVSGSREARVRGEWRCPRMREHITRPREAGLPAPCPDCYSVRVVEVRDWAFDACVTLGHNVPRATKVDE